MNTNVAHQLFLLSTRHFRSFYKAFNKCYCDSVTTWEQSFGFIEVTNLEKDCPDVITDRAQGSKRKSQRDFFIQDRHTNMQIVNLISHGKILESVKILSVQLSHISNTTTANWGMRFDISSILVLCLWRARLNTSEIQVHQHLWAQASRC